MDDMVLRTIYLTAKLDKQLSEYWLAFQASVANDPRFEELTKNDLIRAAIASKLKAWIENEDELLENLTRPEIPDDQILADSILDNLDLAS